MIVLPAAGAAGEFSINLFFSTITTIFAGNNYQPNGL
jgi:hypothetical protein